MDKVEYRELIRNIKNKYLQKDYEGVIEAADQLDPEKIRENSILEILAKAYEAVGRSDLARDMLLIAYKRTPSGKRIAYNLTMLSIKLDDLDSAVMFYEDFCKMAPKDSQRLLLKYEIGKAGGISVSDLAKVLESYNAREMDDKWEYELARLYHEMGDDEKCAAACDQIILWYADGEYEKKALELKNMHKALTPAQQARYEEIMANILYNTPGTEEYEINKVLDIQPLDPDAPKQEEEKQEDVRKAEEEQAEAAKDAAEEPELPQIDYETTHLEPQMFTEETESEDEENIAGQLSLSAMLDAFRNQTVEDREQMNRMGEDRAAQILAEVNDTHDSSHLEQFEKDVNENEPVSEVIEPEVPLLSREDVTELVDDGGEDLGERAAEFAFEKEGEEPEPETPQTIESSVDATQFIPVDQIAAQLPEESLEEDDGEKVAPSVVRETDVFEEIDPGSAAGKVAVGSSGLDVEELIREAGLEEKEVSSGQEEEVSQEPVSEETAQEEPKETVPEEAQEEPAETAPEESREESEEPAEQEVQAEAKAPEKEFQLDLIFGNSVIPQRTRRVRTPEPVKEPVIEETVKETEEAAEETAEEISETVEETAEAAAQAVEEAAEEAAEVSEETAEAVEEAAEEIAEEVEEAAEETAEAVEETVEETAEETAEAVEEAAEEAVEEAAAVEAAAEETIEETIEEAAEEAAEETEAAEDFFEEIMEEAAKEADEPQERSEEEPAVSRSRAQEDAILNAGTFSFSETFKKTDPVRRGNLREDKEKAKEEKLKRKQEKAKLREEKQRERRLRAEEQRVEKFREKKRREEMLREERALQEEQAARAAEQEAAQEAVLQEEAAAVPAPEMPAEEPVWQPETVEPADAQEPEEDAPEAAGPVRKARGFLGSLFAKKERREEEEEEPADEEMTQDTAQEEEPQAEAEELQEVPEEEPILPEEQEEQEVAAQAAAAETIEKLREFVAREEENAAEETEEESAEETAPEATAQETAEETSEATEETTEEETGEVAEEETEEEDEQEITPEPVRNPVPELKKPETNPEADAAAAAALERFRQLSAKEEEEDWLANIQIRETKESIEPEQVRQEVPVRPSRGYQEEPVRPRRGNKEEPVRPLRGNKVYKGNKDPQKAKSRTVPDLFDENRNSRPSYKEAQNRSEKKKKARNRKASEQFGEELFAQEQGNHMERETIDIDELLNAALQNGTSKKKEEITEEALNMLLNSSIDLHKTEEKTEKSKKKPEKELTVSESGEYDLEGFISKDNRKEITRQMSFDDLFGGEFRPKVRIPAEAVGKTQEKHLVFSKKYTLSEEQRKALSEFLMIEGMEEAICDAIDNLITKKRSGDDTGGHMIVTGAAKSGKTYLTIEILKAVNQEVGHGNPRIAKVQAQAINGKNIRKVLAKVTDSDLIIENIGKLEDATIRDIITAVRENNASTMVILEGNVIAADTMIQRFPDVARVFKTRIDIGELTLTQWADIAQKYARSQGYSIEGPALLALHARLGKINTSDRRLGNEQVKEIVDEAIEKTQSRGSGKLFSAFARKTEDAPVPLTEDSFM